MGDTERSYDVQAVKDRLNAYREAEKEIANQTELLERLQSKLEGLGAKEITDMPRSPSPSMDRISGLLNQKMEIEEMIAEDVAALQEERRAIEKILKQLRSANERAVIRFRYFIGLDWYDVTNALFGGREDYLDREETYLKQVFRIHGKALLNIAILTEEKAGLD